MRYTSEHKQQSRLKIVEAARSLFRRNGFDGASIDQVMAAAGLTRGAFYAHFSSKEELIAEVLAVEAGLTATLHRAAGESDPAAAKAAAIVKYLSPAERINNATGCPLVAHPVDAIRGSDSRRNGYTDRFKALLAGLDGPDAAAGSEPSDRAVVMAVLLVGGALLSAAIDDEALADRIEDLSLQRVTTLL